MDILQIKTETKQYPVYIGSRILHHLASFLTAGGISNLMVIADERVNELHGQTLLQHLPESLEVSVFTVPAGEAAKTLEVYDECMTFAINKGLDRQSCILAFGGGACGDLAGFVAATYMRGIRFVGVPTTILAHDSSVGGKVAVNHKLGKNMIGQFYHPEAVFYDTAFLKSLPLKEVRSGMAEVIKHSLISDEEFYRNLLNNIRSFSTIEPEFLINCLKQGIAVKAGIVANDERENGIRAFLNFGHTYGHALENLGGYKEISHGESVMAGMVFALFLSKRLSCLRFDLSEFIMWAKELGYPLSFSKKYLFEDIYEVMTRDKKAANKIPKFVLLSDIGTPLLKEVSRMDLKEAHDFVSAIKGD
ncbi:3-dehydroquinate synthase [Bacillus salacetis]|uniref:3-dehydroquinate synthase n=1 Tax=Bacillus salacetis TaxID=2315464 RepID=A0A3A1QWV9_9BACI|nr:3-dehydroquinate synthase [Bacillus salacetis]RIW33147.1 3-dehydroquinate synthase [Bacillus salacetis]